MRDGVMTSNAELAEIAGSSQQAQKTLRPLRALRSTSSLRPQKSNCTLILTNRAVVMFSGFMYVGP